MGGESLFGQGGDDAEGGLEGRFAYFLFEATLQLVEGADDADGGLAALGFEGEVIGAGVVGIAVEPRGSSR